MPKEHEITEFGWVHFVHPQFGTINICCICRGMHEWDYDRILRQTGENRITLSFPDGKVKAVRGHEELCQRKNFKGLYTIVMDD